MAITLELRLTTKGQNIKGQLAVECKTKNGTQLKRHYKLVQGLKSPAYTPDCWNEKQGLFIAGENAAYNNQVTKSLIDALNALIATNSYTDGKQLFAAYEYALTHVVASKSMSLADYITLVLESEKERPTSNYELYNTLLNILNGKNKKRKNHTIEFEPAKFNGIKLADTPLNQIGNRHFEAFGIWIKTAKGGKGYKNLMTTFKAVISRAQKAGLTEMALTYDWRKYRPIKEQKAMTAKQRIEAKGREISILTADEFSQFEAFDVLAVVPPLKHSQQLAQLYKDAVLLMYYTKSRPTDVIGFTWAGNYDEDSNTLVYTPRKLAYRPDANGKTKVVTIQLPQQAVEIINRYKGQSKGGYLLPLPMNEIGWNVVTDFNSWNIRVKNVEQRINKLLKKIATALQLAVSDLSMYDFRHSAITHALNAGENPFAVAQMAGTSVAKIEQHYYNGIRK
jgi:integrase